MTLVEVARRSLKLDISKDFINLQKVVQNVLTHATSPEAYDIICETGEVCGFVSDDVRYDGFSDNVQPLRSAFFTANPQSDRVLFPWSPYPRHLDIGANIKIILIKASGLLDAEQYNMFYVASTPTQFGPSFMRVYHSHILVVRTDDKTNLELAMKFFTRIAPAQTGATNALIYFEGEQLHVSTRVRVGDQTYPNVVIFSFCIGFRFEPRTLPCIDGKKIGYRDSKVACPENLCLFTAKSTSELKVHYRAVHMNVKAFVCAQCNKEFSLGTNLKAHMARVHEKKSREDVHANESHQCSQCLREFSNNSSLTRHVEGVHRKTKSHRCVHCGKSFSQSSNLKAHITSVHEKKKSFCCPHCDKGFSRKAHLNGHIVSVHEKGKPFACADCNKAFSSKSHLASHIKTVHQKMKPFTCEQCNKGFSRRSHLKSHIASVHEKVKHRCQKCCKTYSRGDHLKIHVKSKHGNE